MKPGRTAILALLFSGAAMILLPLIGLRFPMPVHEAPQTSG